MIITGIYKKLFFNGKIIDNVIWPYELKFDENIVYEVIRLIDGKPLFVKEHTERIANSIKLLGFEFKNIQDHILNAIKEYINGEELNNNIKILIGNIEEDKYDLAIFHVKSFYPTNEMYSNGVDTSTFYFKRNNPKAKILNDEMTNRVNEIRKEENVFEVLLVDDKGFITEGSRSNIFFVEKNQVVLSDFSKVLSGITMIKVIETIKECEIEISEKNISEDDLINFDGCFMTGTSNNILPIKKINDIEFDSSNNYIIKTLIEEFNKKIMGDLLMTNLVENFLKYVQIDTKSESDSISFPSSEKQYDLARLLLKQMKEMGVENSRIDENGYVIGEISSNIEEKVPKIGFIAHMDTSPDFSGENVKPNFVKKYEGGDIVLNKEKNIIMSSTDFPELNNYIGDDLITTDGTTLLGADDKAGIAIIMEMIKNIKENPSIKHGDIRIAFTPDEEIGHGADRFDVQKFDADFAYTVDGGEIGEIEYENFNAASALIKINGLNIHPGTAKHKMKNAILIGMEINSMLPNFEIPGYTEGYEGFYHLNEISGDVSETIMKYIVRDHSKEKFANKKELLNDIITFINKKYGSGTAEIKITDSYYNMKEKIEPVIKIVDIVIEAMKMSEVTPKIKAIRGGTDGSRLSYMGLPTPNIFTGGHNFHGKYEYISIQSMEKAVDVLMNIIKCYTKY